MDLATINNGCVFFSSIVMYLNVDRIKKEWAGLVNKVNWHLIMLKMLV